MTTAGMVPYNWDSSPSCNCGPNFVSVGITNFGKGTKSQKQISFIEQISRHSKTFWEGLRVTSIDRSVLHQRSLGVSVPLVWAFPAFGCSLGLPRPQGRGILETRGD